MIFSILVSMKSRLITFKGEIICEELSTVALSFKSDFVSLLLEGEWPVVLLLDDLGLLVAGFFIESK